MEKEEEQGNALLQRGATETETMKVKNLEFFTGEKVLRGDVEELTATVETATFASS